MRKLANMMLAIVMVVVGWFLEIYYYWFRFTGDGVDSKVALIIGAGLTLLLTSLFIEPTKLKKALIVPLILFSVFCTTSGQAYSYGEKQREANKTSNVEINKQQMIDNYNNSIIGLQAQLESEIKLIDVDLKTRAYLNTNGVTPTLENIENIKKDIKYYQGLRDEILISLKPVEKEKTAYEILADDLGIYNANILKILSLISLSFFIAIMSPSGVYMVQKLFSPVIPESKSRSKEDVIRAYTESRYRGEDKPKTLKGRPEVVKEASISQVAFEKITEMARRHSLLETKGRATIPLVARAEFEETMIRRLV